MKSLMKENLKMDKREVKAIHFSRAHHIGHAHASRQKSRPIVAEVLDTKMKMSIMRRGKELRDTNFSISDQYPPEILRRRRLLHRTMTEAWKNVIDKLYIVRKLCSNLLTYLIPVTYWLGGGEVILSQKNLLQPAAVCSCKQSHTSNFI